MFVVCWSSQQIKHFIRKRVSKQTDFCLQFACGFNLFADIMQTMSQAMSQCVQKYVQFFGDRITEPLFSGSLFAIHRNKHWHNVCFIYTFISFGQLRVSKSRNKKLRRGDKNTQEQKFWSLRHNDQCWCHTYTAINHKTLWQWHYLHFLTEISYSRVKPWLHSQLLDTFHPLKVNIFAVKS